MKKNRLSIKVIGIIIGVLVVFTWLYVVFVIDGEDNDFIEAVNNNAISANVLIINVTRENNSTSYSAGQSGVIFKKDFGRYYLLTALHGIPFGNNSQILVLGYDQLAYSEVDF